MIFWPLIQAMLAAGPPAPPPIRLSPDLAAENAREQWEFSKDAAWTIDGGVLRVGKSVVPSGRIGAPEDWAVFKSEALGSLTIRAAVQCNAPLSEAGRGVVVLLGYESPARFYFVDLSNRTTRSRNGIFLVENGIPRRIDVPGAAALLMDRGWHSIRVIRNVEDGTIRVFPDESRQPIMAATDRTILAGRLGFGSMGGGAAFKDIEIMVESPPSVAPAPVAAPQVAAAPEVSALPDRIIHLSVHVARTPTEAFSYFVEPEKLRAWLAPKAQVDPRVGGSYELYWQPDSPQDNSTIGCRITALVPAELIAFQWRSPVLFKSFANAADPLTHVVVTFVGDNSGTTIHLVHSGWHRTAEWEDARRWQENAWQQALDSLQSKLSSAGARP